MSRQFKLGFIGETDLNAVEADARFARENGFEGIEYNWWASFKDVSRETVVSMHAIHQKYGVRASMLGIWGWNHLHPDQQVRAEAHAMLERAIEYARILGADFLVTGGGVLPGEPLDKNIAEFSKVFPPLLGKIRAAGLQPAFYSMHPASFFDGVEAFERVWQIMPDIKVKFDAANWLGHGDDYLDLLLRHGDKIGYVHIKEWMHDTRGKLISEPPAGMGDIAWGKVLALLYEHNYHGWLSLEPHGEHWSKGPLREKMLLISKKYLEPFLV